MRSHEAGIQATALERVTIKLLTRLNLSQFDDMDMMVAAIGDTVLEAYALGGVEALAIAPLEAKEVVFRARPTPALMGALLNDGWQPWAITETSWRSFEGEPDKAIPAGWKRAKGEPHRNIVTHHGWIVRFTRRAVPRTPVMPTAEIESLARERVELAEAKRREGFCSYPECKCIVQTSTSEPVPACPLSLAPFPQDAITPDARSEA